MAEQIESLIKGQQATLQAVSHELRTPIARIRFRLALLEESEEGNADIAAQTNAVREDVSELESLIDEVLTHHKLTQQPELRFLPFNLSNVILSELAQMNILAPAVEANATVPPELECSGHEHSVQRAIRNLLSNAAKYADQHIAIAVSEQSSHYVVTVEDDGVGLSEEECQKVFEPFYRVDTSRNKHTGGYGLGLAIVKRIVTLHRGEIFAEKSQTLGGAKFVLHLPKRALHVEK